MPSIQADGYNVESGDVIEIEVDTPCDPEMALSVIAEDDTEDPEGGT